MCYCMEASPARNEYRYTAPSPPASADCCCVKNKRPNQIPVGSVRRNVTSSMSHVYQSVAWHDFLTESLSNDQTSGAAGEGVLIGGLFVLPWLSSYTSAGRVQPSFPGRPTYDRCSIRAAQNTRGYIGINIGLRYSTATMNTGFFLDNRSISRFLIIQT